MVRHINNNGVNEEDLKDVHEIRVAYNLPCGTCVYSEWCKKAQINKDNFVKEVIEDDGK